MSVFTVERTLTQLDHLRLTRLVARAQGADSETHEAISDLLVAGEPVPSRTVAPDVVTMYSQVMLQDDERVEPYKVTLCYPNHAEPARGFFSVLSPVGSALLGLHVGSTARWTTPNGQERTAVVKAILFQPEASGDYTA
ncbi:MAG: GreA/GreB family elongation factor [Burkholderiaceae bacterium]